MKTIKDIGLLILLSGLTALVYAEGSTSFTSEGLIETELETESKPKVTAWEHDGLAGLTIHYLKGSQGQEALISAGPQDSTGSATAYLSYFSSADKLYSDGQLIKTESYYSSKRLGFEIYEANEDTLNIVGASFFIYANHLPIDADRFGLGFDVTIGKMLTTNNRLSLTIDIMPEIVSTNWGANAFFEYGTKLSWSYSIHRNLDLKAEFRRNGIIDKNHMRFYQEGLFGLAFKL